MPMSVPLPEFKTEKERQRWIIANARYFTLIRFRNRRYERLEYPTLAEAEAAGVAMKAKESDAKLMIYAVVDHHTDSFVRAIL